ncbi:hypothetical protein E1B28_009594 [Marasmius oreades]|uniref:Uncharacterized protein n=1 Tax=Marasmius oreades TaxID=181124 RepID=A0A9P7RVL9_9AGAR|nr:uncharacterized protein E1B28_009594 [Marasmius oreades]KAG7090480.1 hypothetical protein E1B28_009594 [Marasmius oreades]
MAAVSADILFVSDFGTSIILNAVNLLTGGILYGIYIILFCAAATVLCRREGNVKARAMLLVAIVTMFIMSSFGFWTDITIFFAGVQDILVGNVGQPFGYKQGVFTEQFKNLDSVKQVMLPFEIVVGDSIVIWRAWALSAGNRKMVVIPLLFLIGSAACSFAFLGCFSQHDWPIVNPDTCNSIEISAFSLSIVTNILATIIIGHKFWRYRQIVGRFLSTCYAKQQARTEKILILLLESGIIYSVLWIVQLVEILLPFPPTFAAQVVQQIFIAASVQLMGIYPALLIVLVYLQRSMWDSYGASTLESDSDSNSGSDVSRSILVIEKAV